MISTSKITGKTYDPDKVLYITDVAQWSFYFQNDCEEDVLDILYDPSHNQKRPLCIVFRRSKKMKELYEAWKARKEGEEA